MKRIRNYRNDWVEEKRVFEYDDDTLVYKTGWTCPHCGEWQNLGNRIPFCPYCGKKNIVEVKDGQD